jgi:hypothetical protein
MSCATARFERMDLDGMTQVVDPRSGQSGNVEVVNFTPAPPLDIFVSLHLQAALFVSNKSNINDGYIQTPYVMN